MQFAGERLVYKIEWSPPWYFFFLPAMEAGEASLEMAGETEYSGKKALQIRFKARSSGALVKMSGVKVEDEFIYHTEPGTLCTLSASEKIREGKRKRRIEVQYLRESRQIHVREMDEAVIPPKLKKDETKSNAPECVHDPLSALYLLRQSPLRENYSRTLTLANDDKIKEILSVVEARETIQTMSGKTAVWRINTSALMGGLFKEGGQFKLWISADEKRIPAQFEVKVGLGRIVGRLKPAR